MENPGSRLSARGRRVSVEPVLTHSLLTARLGHCDRHPWDRFDGFASMAGYAVTIILNALFATAWILLVGYRLRRLKVQILRP
jgi:hypothetical protein